MLKPGHQLSHYRLIAKIGQGGMGVVWRARDEKLRRDVALKVLPPDLVEDPERRRRLLREARAAAAINHPNIGTVHEVDEADGTVFMEETLVSIEELVTGLEQLLSVGTIERVYIRGDSLAPFGPVVKAM